MDGLHKCVSSSHAPLVWVKSLPKIGDVGYINEDGAFIPCESEKYGRERDEGLDAPLFFEYKQRHIRPITSKGVSCKLVATITEEEKRYYEVAVNGEVSSGAILIPLAPLKHTSISSEGKRRLRDAMKENARDGPQPQHGNREDLVLVYSYATLDSWIMLTFEGASQSPPMKRFHVVVPFTGPPILEDASERVKMAYSNDLASLDPRCPVYDQPVLLEVLRCSHWWIKKIAPLGWCRANITWMAARKPAKKSFLSRAFKH